MISTSCSSSSDGLRESAVHLSIETPFPDIKSLSNLGPSLGLKKERVSHLRRHFFHDLQECDTRLRQMRLPPIDQPQLPFKLQFRNCNAHQFPAIDLRLRR